MKTRSLCPRCGGYQIDDDRAGTLTLPGSCQDVAECRGRPLHMPIAPPAGIETFVKGLWLYAFAGLLENVDGEDREIAEARVACCIRMRLPPPGTLGDGVIEIDRGVSVGPATASGVNGRIGFFQQAAGGDWVITMDLTPQWVALGDWGNVTPT